MLEHDLTCPVRQTRHPTVTELYDSGPDARRPAGQGRAEARLSPVPCRPGAPAGPGTFRARRPTCAALVLTSPSRHSPPPRRRDAGAGRRGLRRPGRGRAEGGALRPPRRPSPASSLPQPRPHAPALPSSLPPRTQWMKATVQRSGGPPRPAFRGEHIR